MRVGIRLAVFARKMCTVILVGVVTIGMVVPVRDVAMGQSGTGSQAPSYTAIDLNPNGFIQSFANGIAGGRVVGNGIGSGTSFTFPGHALMWRGTAASVVDLHQFLPQDFATSLALGIDATGDVVGSATRASDMFLGRSHAIWWHRTGTGFVGTDLHPPSGFLQSAALGISGGKQVGSGTPPGGSALPHALSWSGSPGSVVDLQPPGFISSEASSIAGGQIVGDGGLPGIPCGPGCVVEPGHALSWGSAGSAVDIHPAGFSNSSALGISGAQIVGSGCPGAARSFCAGPNHALLWGSGGSVVDLHPSRFDVSQALGTNGRQQVGTGVTGGHEHALVWSGSASTVVDLHRFLPSNFTDSRATAIDSSGNIVGWASDGRNPHAFLWTPAGVAVIILPGLLGSWTPRLRDAFATGNLLNLPALIADFATMVRIHLPPAQIKEDAVYDDLINTLKGKGIDVFVMPWDWANGGYQRAAADLDQFIRERNFDKVDIIAHSAGGVVAQQYIQDRLNASEDPHVRNLILLGTPNQGTLLVHCLYYVEPVACPTDVAQAQQQREIVSLLLNASPALGVSSLVVAQSIATFRDLMPTFSYMRNFLFPSSPLFVKVDNVYLRGLNSRTLSAIPQFRAAGVTPYTIRGTEVQTPGIFVVRPSINPLKPFVIIQTIRKGFSGDDTVLIGSSAIPGFNDVPVPNATHQGGLLNCMKEAYPRLRDTGTLVCSPPPRRANTYIDIQAGSPVRILLADPGGRRTGTEFATGTNIAEIPTSKYFVSEHPAIFVTEAIQGKYTLEVLGIGNGGDFELGMVVPNAFPNGFDMTVQNFSGRIRPGQRLRFVFDTFAFRGVTNLFAAFTARLEINSASTAFEMNSTFTLGSGGTISPVTQPVTIQVGDGFLVTIPAGSFRSVENGRRFVFEGTVNGVALEANLTPAGGNSYALKVEGAGARNLPRINPVEARIAIGNNGGSVSVNAEFER